MGQYTLTQKKYLTLACFIVIRVRAIHIPGSDRWALRIQETKVSDSGEYECQEKDEMEIILFIG